MADITAREHVLLNSLEKYIEDVIECSDTIADVHNDIRENKRTAEYNYSYAMEHINDEYDRLESNIHSDLSATVGRLEDDIESLKSDIEELKQIIQEKS
jgi:SMC interacting uncharacterized protein involved in chromosome segregation